MTAAEVLFYIAAVLFAVAGVASLVARSIIGALVPIGLACVAVALGLLVV